MHMGMNLHKIVKKKKNVFYLVNFYHKSRNENSQSYHSHPSVVFSSSIFKDFSVWGISAAFLIKKDECCKKQKQIVIGCMVFDDDYKTSKV